MKIEVTEEEKIRLDKYLANKTDYSRATIAKMLEQGLIKVNDKEEKASYLIKVGDILFLEEYKEKKDIIKTPMEIDIIYEDEDIIVVNKPSGLVVHPGSGNYQNTLVNGLMYYTDELSDENGEERPGIVHRIDKDTSGLLLIAKNNKTHQILTEYFKNKEVKREYLALLCGTFPHDQATIDAPIGRDPQDRKKMTVIAKNSKKAITHLKVEKRFKNYTLVRLTLDTGRTHQIRVHMEYIGYPVYNDPVYNKKKASEFGQFLHSAKMDFIHPITKKEMHFESPLPDTFKQFIDSLEIDQT